PRRSGRSRRRRRGLAACHRASHPRALPGQYLDPACFDPAWTSLRRWSSPAGSLRENAAAIYWTRGQCGAVAASFAGGSLARDGRPVPPTLSPSYTRRSIRVRENAVFAALVSSPPLAEAWHELYVMLGTSSAALIGLLFVATSLHLREIANQDIYRLRA